MQIIISANGYPEINNTIEISAESLRERLASGEIYFCTAGCNDTGMNDDPPIYHSKNDYRS